MSEYLSESDRYSSFCFILSLNTQRARWISNTPSDLQTNSPPILTNPLKGLGVVAQGSAIWPVDFGIAQHLHLLPELTLADKD